MEWYSFRIENWRGKLLWILHPFDTYEEHSERYYNLKSVQKVVKRVYEREIKSVKEIKCPKCNSVLTGWEEMSSLVCSDEVISTWAGDCKMCDKSYGFKVHYPIKNYEILDRD